MKRTRFSFGWVWGEGEGVFESGAMLTPSEAERLEKHLAKLEQRGEIDRPYVETYSDYMPWPSYSLALAEVRNAVKHNVS